MTRPPILTARHYALLAAGVAAFTVYGSLVPFHYHHRPWDDAVKAYSRAMRTRIEIASRSDTAANFLLGVPLGFCLLGACRVDRPGWPAGAGAAVLLWPWCVGLAAAVEFAQLYFPGRTCSSNDVAAQAAGSAVGLTLWVLAGQRMTNFARRAWDSPRAGGVAGKILLGYVAVVALIQLLPLDISVSPADVYRKVRDKQGVLVPFGELYQRDGTSAPDRDAKVGNWASLVGLYLPVGLLAARLPWGRLRTWGGLPLVAVAGFGLALLLEGGQVFVSRAPSTTDALFGGLGVVAGWAAVRGFPELSPEAALVRGQVWLAVLTVVNWYPYDFGQGKAAAGVTARLGAVNWVPLADTEEADYVMGLQQLLQKATLFIPFGVLVVAVGRPPTGSGRVLAGAAVGALAAALVEFGQVLLPRYPSVTDVVLGAAAAYVGAVVARRLRGTGAP